MKGREQRTKITYLTKVFLKSMISQLIRGWVAMKEWADQNFSWECGRQKEVTSINDLWGVVSVL